MTLLARALRALADASRAARTPRGGPPPLSTRYPGDYQGRRILPQYAPSLNGKPDPGEVVWTWVTYEEDDSRGKDRPVLLIGRDGRWLLGLMLSSADHDRDNADEARWGRHWMDIGAGAWDAHGTRFSVETARKRLAHGIDAPAHAVLRLQQQRIMPSLEQFVGSR